MNIDLTKLTLEEVQNLTLGTKDGQTVRIYANDGTGLFPLHGAIKCGSGWCMEHWNKNGRLPTKFKNPGADLKLKPRTIDFTQLPVDTLVSYKGDICYIVEKGNNFILLSFCTSKSYRHIADTLTSRIPGKNTDLKLVKGRKIVWEGKNNKCPLPNGVEVKVGYRAGGFDTFPCNIKSIKWEHRLDDNDIIWYQITGRIV